MQQPACRTLALEFLPKQRCLILYAGTEQPTDAAWDMYLDQLRVPDHVYKILVVTEGSRPTRAQQARLSEVVNIHRAYTAVISPVLAVRFVVSGVSLFKPNVRYFTTDQTRDAFEYLELSTADRTMVERAVNQLRKQLHSTH